MFVLRCLYRAFGCSLRRGKNWQGKVFEDNDCAKLLKRLTRAEQETSAIVAVFLESSALSCYSRKSEYPKPQLPVASFGNLATYRSYCLG